MPLHAMFDSMHRTESVAPGLCLQPSYLRNDGFARLEVFERIAWEGQDEKMYLLWCISLKNGLRCCLLAGCCSQASAKALWGVNGSGLGRAWAPQPSCSCSSASLGLLPVFLTPCPTLCVLTCTLTLIHIASDVFYENTNSGFFFPKEIQCSSIKNNTN